MTGLLAPCDSLYLLIIFSIHNVSNKGSNDARGSLEETKTEISEMLYGGPWIDLQVDRKRQILSSLGIPLKDFQRLWHPLVSTGGNNKYSSKTIQH